MAEIHYETITSICRLSWLYLVIVEKKYRRYKNEYSLDVWPEMTTYFPYRQERDHYTAPHPTRI